MSLRVKKTGAALLAAITLLLPFYPVLAAQVIPEIQPLKKPFGGKITKIQACISPAGLILHIGPPSEGQYFFNPAASTLHLYKVIMPEVWTLGLAQPIAITCVGNPKSVGGFSLLGSGASLITATPLLNEFGEVVGTILSGPLGDFFITGELGVALASLIPGLDLIMIAYAVYSLISYLKKPPTLGPAYPIIRIGTGPAPTSLPLTQSSTP